MVSVNCLTPGIDMSWVPTTSKTVTLPLLEEQATMVESKLQAVFLH